MQPIHFIAVGANLPAPSGATPLQSCEAAAARIAALPGIRGACRGRWFASAPVPASGQPHYINGVLRLNGTLQPAMLLRLCQAIERAAGRTRSGPNAARTLDIDIIDMAGLVRTAPDPVLPHPRAHLRAFVLLPLRDVAPGWRHPVSGQSIDCLLAALPPQDIHPI